MKSDVNLKSKEGVRGGVPGAQGVRGVVKGGTGADTGWGVSWGRGGSPHPKYLWMPVRVGSLCGNHPGGRVTVSPTASGRNIPSQNSFAQLPQKLLARTVGSLCPDHLPGLGRAVPASDPLQPKMLGKHLAPALLWGWEMPFPPPPPC